MKQQGIHDIAHDGDRMPKRSRDHSSTNFHTFHGIDAECEAKQIRGLFDEQLRVQHDLGARERLRNWGNPPWLPRRAA